MTNTEFTVPMPEAILSLNPLAQLCFPNPETAIRLALEVLRRTYDVLPDDLPTEARLALLDILIGGPCLRLNLFLGSNQDKPEIERNLAALEFEEEEEEDTEHNELTGPTPY